MSADKVIEIQKDIRAKAEDYKEFMDSLATWETDIKATDSGVARKNKIEADYPPVRGTVDEAAVLKQEAAKKLDDPILKHKDLGNDLFKKGKYSEAAKAYADGIALDPDDKNAYVLHGNRAMALLKTQSFEAAETEASECVRKNRTYTKGFFRRALARRALGKLKECSDDFSTVLVLEPDNKEAKSQLAQVQAELKSKQKEEQKAAAPPRKKLQITEVDDDDDSEDEVDVPIKRKTPPPATAAATPAPTTTTAAAAAAAAPPAKAQAPHPVPAPKPKQKQPEKEGRVPNAPSGVEVVDDDEEEVSFGRVLTKPAKPATEERPASPPPAAAPAPVPAAAPAAVAAPAAAPTTTAAGSPRARSGRVVPSETALKAAEEYQSKSHEEVPRDSLAFEKVWERLGSDKLAERASYLRLVPREKYSDFFRTNISEDVLEGVVRVVHDVFTKGEEAGDQRRALGILRQLAQLDRLSALVIFLESEVVEKLEASPGRLLANPGPLSAAEIKAVARDLKRRLED